MTMDRPLPRSKWKKPLIVCGVLTAAAALAWAAQSFRAQRSARLPTVSVTLATAARGVFHDFVPLRGRVVPRDIVYLDAQEGGRVERVLVQAGDIVTAGQPLVEFGNTELQLEVIDREARLIEQINNLRATEMALEQNRVANVKALQDIDYNLVRLTRLADRRNALAGRGAASAEEKEKVMDELVYYRNLRPLTEATTRRQELMSAARLPEIRDGLEKLQQDLLITRGKLDNLIVRAPVSGRLTDMDLKVGESCERGRRLAQITPDTGYKLSADVDEFYLGRLRTGQRAAVRIADRDWALHVTRVYPQVKDGVFLVDLAFENGMPEGLLPGQAIQGKLALGNDAPGIILPSGAFLERTGGDWAFVLDNDGHSAQRRRIKVGRRNSEQLEVLSGLTPGERVITSDYTGLDRIERVDLMH